jgi:hypothetical protein
MRGFFDQEKLAACDTKIAVSGEQPMNRVQCYILIVSSGILFYIAFQQLFWREPVHVRDLMEVSFEYGFHCRDGGFSYPQCRAKYLSNMQNALAAAKNLR